MSKVTSLLDLIPYPEVYSILKGKFNVTHDELRYWVKKGIESLYMKDILDDDNLLIPFISDLPFIDTYAVPKKEFFYPEYYFYPKKNILNFMPLPPLRFVYRKDLTGLRNWNNYRDSSCPNLLLKANECGILRFYDHSLDDFTFFATKSQKWCDSSWGEDYVDKPESFFLLYDILNVERIFLGKEKELCLNELHLKPADLPKNVIPLKIRKE